MREKNSNKVALKNKLKLWGLNVCTLEAFSLFGIQTVSSVALTADLHCYTVPTTSQSSASLVKFLSSWQIFSINGQISVAAYSILPL